MPDGDLFKALRAGKASIVTDRIDTFTETGIRLKSGKELQADIVIAATGLQLQSLGGMALRVDGQPRAKQLMTYKAVLLQDVPNMAWLFGYINASWTLKADMAATYVCRLLNHMQHEGRRRRHRACAARADAGRHHHGHAAARATCSAARRCCRGKAEACPGACCTMSSKTARCC